MRQFGYLEQGTPDSEALYTHDAIVDAIKNVQKFGALPQTGELDNATLEVFHYTAITLEELSVLLLYNKIFSMSNNFYT